ncbi:MAG TPA: GntR family transcriptional regulator [Clostridiales bacterium]|nr:GntR family transcriptional regulator [Clostridiales bacterium]
MPVEFTAETPIYLQLCQLFRQAIAAGELPPGSRVPSVRDLAIEYGVNPNTVQRALAELERDGLLYAERTAGRFITADASRIEAIRSDLVERQIEGFFRQMHGLGYQKEQLLKILAEKWSDQDGND